MSYLESNRTLCWNCPIEWSPSSHPRSRCFSSRTNSAPRGLDSAARASSRRSSPIRFLRWCRPSCTAVVWEPGAGRWPRQEWRPRRMLLIDRYACGMMCQIDIKIGIRSNQKIILYDRNSKAINRIRFKLIRVGHHLVPFKLHYSNHYIFYSHWKEFRSFC